MEIKRKFSAKEKVKIIEKARDEMVEKLTGIILTFEKEHKVICFQDVRSNRKIDIGVSIDLETL
jgi:hypothetical protein